MTTDHPPIDAPFGSWATDRILSYMQPSRPIHWVGHGYVSVFEEKYVFKVFHEEDPSQPLLIRPKVEHELRMMLIAGSDSVQLIGRLFDDTNQKLIGFIMPYEHALAPGVDIGGEPGERAKEIIDKLCRLIKRLQARQIIHGDVKPSNLLLCSDGQVRLCDWALASVNGDNFIAYAVSDHYASSRRCCLPQEPLALEEDLYATGVSIWEIWMEKVPFEDVEEVIVDELVMGGIRPDVQAVDDPEIAALIESFLDAGPVSPNKPGQTRTVCTQVGVKFNDCRTTPAHVETRIVKCYHCQDPDTQQCAKPFRLPNVQVDFSIPVCPKCNPI
ncbi:kinase-like domain-containing protein [Lentinula lateritia]|uniref:Kinase-like domain-containing protein n=1 Tax=Lentinula aff. lateritia TaxID=2804960 RepID=A0ACC1TZ09_9AGAR|nr:kinase-like domain-containing protein [Lentinula aff. lateritia]KAJ3851867.1 kinase-like domain-containing protein [Lentinula lateritia]